MDRVSINLLPKEVLEKWKSEQQLAFMLLGVVVMVILLISVYGFNFVRIIQEQTDLEIIKAENSRVQVEIAKIGDFEKVRSLVEQRQNLINTITSKKYSWSRLLNNISLIVPNEIWLTRLEVEEEGKLSFSGKALAGTKTSGIGHKPVAKWLVHMSELSDIGDVWLTASKKGAADIGSEVGPSLSTTAPLDQSSIVEFESRAVIKSLGANASSPAPGGKI
ncbi:MAG TPA: hypothetical protein ENI11_06325 [Actinobacteria bacterium]|nr:hypothetical protein [Actinomycetota bacterium]